MNHFDDSALVIMMFHNDMPKLKRTCKSAGVEVVMAIAKKADSKNIKSGAAAVMKVLVGSSVYEENPVEEEETVMSA